MKKSILFFAFVCLAMSQLQAQSSFDEATFNGMMARWAKDPVSFFKNECDSKFMFTNGNGEVHNQEQAIATYTNVVAKATKKVENLKVWQVENTGIATGKTIESYVFKNGKTANYTGVFTYTFAQQNSKWVIASAQHTDVKAPAFTDQTMKEILDEYKNDSKAFFINRLSDDFRYTNPQGNYLGREAGVKWDKQNIVATELLQPVTFQSGDLAITSGIHQTVRTDKDGIQRTGQVTCTYTFQRRNGKWLFVASQQNSIATPVAEDEEAIKKVLGEETAAFDNADYKTYLSHYSKTQYTSFLYSGGLFVGDNLWKQLEGVFATRKAQKVIRIRSNWNIRINGASAFVTYSQANEFAETNTKNETYEERYLEKVSSEWKIVNTTVILTK